MGNPGSYLNFIPMISEDQWELPIPESSPVLIITPDTSIRKISIYTLPTYI